MNGLKEVIVWGTGKAMREFLFVDDMVSACLFVHELDKQILKKYKRKKPIKHINIGTGEDITIKELAEKIKKVVDYNGRIVFDSTRQDGAPRKLLNVDLIKNLGWKP